MTAAAMDKLIQALWLAGVDFTAEDLADALWLAPRLPARPDVLESMRKAVDPGARPTPATLLPAEETTKDREDTTSKGAVPATEAAEQKAVDVHLPGPATVSGESLHGVQVRLPGAAGIPDALAMARALRPFRRRQTTTRDVRLDESRTAERLAATDIWLPVLFPGKERWLSAALVVDAGASMAIWQTVLREFQHLLETLGAFRRVEQWCLDTEDPAWTLDPASPTPLFASQRLHLYRKPLDLVDPSGRQIILVVSDCVSDAWWDGRVARLLRLWGRCDHTAILQVLPRTMWERTALGPDQGIVLRSRRAACPNALIDALSPTRFRGLRKVSIPGAISMPVLEFSAGALRAWSQWVAEDSGGMLAGRLLESAPAAGEADEDDAWTQGLGQPFLSLASRPARKLANIMAVAPPFNLSLLRVIRESMLSGEATQVHEAEFLLGGLVKIVAGSKLRFERPDEALYDFDSDDLRKMLRAAVPVPDALNLLRIEQVSRFLGQRLGQPSNFPAYLASPASYAGALELGPAEARDPIARFTSDILQWFGDSYAGLLRKTTIRPLVPAADAATAPASAETPSEVGEPGPLHAAQVRMRIRVVGSASTSPDSEFKAFCENFGREIGRRGHTLVIATTDSADRPALDGFASGSPAGHIILVERISSTHRVELPYEPPLHVSRVYREDSYGAGAAAVADAVVAIGGAANTRVAFETALDRRIPVLSLPHFGGTGAALYRRALAALEASGVAADQIAKLEEKDLAKLPSALLDVLEAWHEARRRQLGAQRARAVCLVETSESQFATGFLVAPGLLFTPNHVIGDREVAAVSRIRFEDRVEFALAPDTLFVTDPGLDFTVVAVSPTSTGGHPWGTRETLSLRSQPLVAGGERVHIVAYGIDKALIRSVGEVTRTDDQFVGYRAAMARGSSGAPVFNDNWDLVAMHRAVRSTSGGERNWEREGTRISAIATALAIAEGPLHPLLADALGIAQGHAVVPSIWILIAGTGLHQLPPTILAAAERVGQWIANQGYGLITGGWIGVDYVVARAFASTLRGKGLPVASSLVHVISPDRRPDFEEGQIRYEANDIVTIDKSVELADGVVLIGGMGGTKEVGLRALNVRVPVFPLAATGGDAGEIFKTIVEGWDDYSWLPMTGAEFLSFLEDEPDLDLIGAIVRRNMREKPEREPTGTSALQKERLLFLSTNPPDYVRLDIEREFLEIRNALHSSEFSDTLQLEFRPGVGPDGLGEALAQFEPHLLHISGHGSVDGIALGESVANAGRLGKQELEQLVQLHAGTLRLVVLNVSQSSELAEALVRHIACAIGINGTIADATAIGFAASFYRALASSQSVKASFEYALSRTDAEWLGRDGYALMVRPGIEPSQVFLVSGSHASGSRAEAPTDAISPVQFANLTGRRAKVLVVGSCRKPESPDELDAFVNSCRLLGKALAEAVLTIIVGSSSTTNADYHILDGANQADRWGDVLILQPKTDAVGLAFETRFPNLVIQGQVFDGRWSEVRKRQVQAADVVVAIGGGKGTAATMRAADDINKPLVPLGAFSGTSRAAWPAARRALSAAGLSDETIDSLENRFDTAVIVDALRRLSPPARSAPAGIPSPERRREVLSSFQDTLAQLRGLIELLYGQKRLHDLLHKLELGCVIPMAQEMKRFPDEQGSREQLEDYQADLQQITDDIRAELDRAGTLPGQAEWATRLRAAPAELRKAIEASDRRGLERVVSLLNRVISREPQRINDRMNDAAHALTASGLIGTMEAQSIQVIGVLGAEFSAEGRRALEEGSNDSIDLARRVTALAEEHDRWQQVDVELRNLANASEPLADALDWSWPEVRARVETIVTGSPEPWARTFREANARLLNAMEDKDDARTRDSFLQFRRQVSEQFYRVDQELLKLIELLRDAVQRLASTFAPS